MNTIVTQQSQPTINYNINDKHIPNIKVGTSVKHKTFGVGKVKSIDSAQNHIVISFSAGEKMFIFPDAFIKGYLELT